MDGLYQPLWFLYRKFNFASIVGFVHFTARFKKGRRAGNQGKRLRVTNSSSCKSTGNKHKHSEKSGVIFVLFSTAIL